MSKTTEKQKEYFREYKRKNREKIREQNKAWRERNRDKLNDLSNAWRRVNVEKALLTQARYRAKTRGLEFNLELDDIVIPDVCPVLGIKLDAFPSSRQDCSPSLDRLDSSKGYIKGNVKVISWRANRLKGDGSIEEFKNIIKYIEDNT